MNNRTAVESRATASREEVILISVFALDRSRGLIAVSPQERPQWTSDPLDSYLVMKD